jgi:nitroimidazol reductase NimA-like FMN-containing flavoprotein (pyridoxamine 5'-phosphate oxidase superfamily)
VIDINATGATLWFDSEGTQYMAKSLKNKVFELVSAHYSGALATVGAHETPHVATVYCLVTKDLLFYFVTRIESRKFANLSTNSQVALAFTNEAAMETVQLTGTAERVESYEDEQRIFYKLMTQRYATPGWPPPALSMFERGDSRELAVIRISPMELSYANFQKLSNGRYRPFFHKVL